VHILTQGLSLFKIASRPINLYYPTCYYLLGRHHLNSQIFGYTLQVQDDLIDIVSLFAQERKTVKVYI